MKAKIPDAKTNNVLSKCSMPNETLTENASILTANARKPGLNGAAAIRPTGQAAKRGSAGLLGGLFLFSAPGVTEHDLDRHHQRSS